VGLSNHAIVKYGDNISMHTARCRLGFEPEPYRQLTSHFMVKEVTMQHLYSNRAFNIFIESVIYDPHRTLTDNPLKAVFSEMIRLH